MVIFYTSLCVLHDVKFISGTLCVHNKSDIEKRNINFYDTKCKESVTA